MGLFRNIFDLEKGEFITRTSKNTGMNLDGELFIRLSDTSAMDEKGNIHITSSWKDDDDDSL